MLETETASTGHNLSTTPSEYDPYVCTVDSKFKKIALDELHEDDNIRGQALAQFREWIAKHPRIKKCRTDAIFLLRFLRTKKFNVSAACLMLEKYLTIRQLFPNWFRNLDIEIPEIEEILDTGYLVPLLERDSFGRTIMLSCGRKFDPYRFTAAQLTKTHALVTEAYLDDEESQIAGYTYINDESGLTMGHVSIWSLVDLKRLIKCFQDSAPQRHKESHFINLPSYACKIVDLLKSLVNDKFRNRILIHRDMDGLSSKIDKDILPAEYGGKVPISEMVLKMKERIRAKREEILALDDMCIDISKIPDEFNICDDGDIDAGTVGSFRKLCVD